MLFASFGTASFPRHVELPGQAATMLRSPNLGQMSPVPVLRERLLEVWLGEGNAIGTDSGVEPGVGQPLHRSKRAPCATAAAFR